MVRFVTEKNRIRLRINLEAAKAVNLTISSKLLRPAEIVTAGNNYPMFSCRERVPAEPEGLTLLGSGRVAT